MTTFWIIAAGLSALVLLIILPALVGRARLSRVSRQDLNLAIYRERVEELERGDIGIGNDPEEARTARAELERELLTELAPEAPPAASPGPGGRWLLAGIVAVGVPALALAVYLQVGTPQAVLMASAGAGAHPRAGDQPAAMQDMVTLVEGLARRMEQEPDNLQGWLMLGQSYILLERFAEAGQSYARAAAIAPEDPNVLVGLAEARALAEDGQFSGAIENLLEKALALNPTHQNGLWLIGLAMFQKEDYGRAVGYWERLTGLPINSEEARFIGGFLEEAKTRLAAEGGDAISPPPAAAEQATPLPATASAPETPPAAAEDIRGSQRRIEVRVALAPELSGRAAPGDIVFVYARAAEGPRMPLAIARKTVGELPATVVLDDSMAMSPEMSLSSFPDVVVGARVSRSGNAMPQAGDLEGQSSTLAAGFAGTVEVRIDREI